MLFNTFSFWLFFAVVFALFVASPTRLRKVILLVASYVFYGMWDWRFLSLIFISTVVDFFCAAAIEKSDSPTRRKSFLTLSIATNLGILGFFKYFNFFVENLVTLLATADVTVSALTLNIVLPVGISFYTFQTMSYTIDVYRNQASTTRSFLDFANYVAFFPQLVAGPIERAGHLLGQLELLSRAHLRQIMEGLSLIMLGLFMKVYVADNLAKTVDPIFSAESASGAVYLIGTYAFAFQILGDFAGYSSIARGLAKCMGIELMVNFHAPYFAAGPQEFWRRWHISLSTWLRDYLYISLGGNRSGRVLTMRNLMLTMLLGGLWHGAAWTFVVWGAIHGGLLAVQRAMIGLGISLRAIPRAVKIVIFFHLVCLTWVFFRAANLDHALGILNSVIFDFSVERSLLQPVFDLARFAGPLLILQYIEYRRRDPEWLINVHWVAQGSIYAVLMLLIIVFGVMDGNEFIYFQF